MHDGSDVKLIISPHALGFCLSFIREGSSQKFVENPWSREQFGWFVFLGWLEAFKVTETLTTGVIKHNYRIFNSWINENHNVQDLFLGL